MTVETAPRGPVGGRAPVLVVLLMLAAVAGATLTGTGAVAVSALALLVAVVVPFRHAVLAWRNLLALALIVILFVPMRRYALPGSLPFQLDLYRIVIAFLLLGWVFSLLVDPATRLRRTGLGAPLAFVVAATLVSDLANGGRVAAAGSNVGKNLTFFLSYVVVVLVVVSVTRTRADLDRLLMVLVGGGAVVAFFAVVESRTHYNVFDHLSRVMPLLRHTEADGVADPTRGYRTYASAQHPIALSAALMMIAPISIYLVRRTRERRWWIAGFLLLAGTVSTVSRTSVIMLLVLVLVLLLLRGRELRRMWPAVLPLLVAVHFALPGMLGTLHQSFFPSGGLVEQQAGAVGTSGQGRLADVGPALDRWWADPLFGEGYATRKIGAPTVDGQILDDQWLGSLVETGLLGVGAWLWLILRSVRRLGRAARLDRSDDGWLLTALTASIAAFAVGMFFFDAFAFIQSTVIFFVLLAFGSVLALGDRAEPAAQ